MGRWRRDRAREHAENHRGYVHCSRGGAGDGGRSARS
nr:MAG TPA: hypothetical protein [Caudoviricetes sp.]